MCARACEHVVVVLLVLQVGEAGLAQSVGNFKNTAYDLKLLLGKTWGDQEFEQTVSQLAYKVSKGDEGQVLVHACGCSDWMRCDSVFAFSTLWSNAAHVAPLLLLCLLLPRSRCSMPARRCAWRLNR